MNDPKKQVSICTNRGNVPSYITYVQRENLFFLNLSVVEQRKEFDILK